MLIFFNRFDGMVAPILDYGSAVWGLKDYGCITAVHNRACRVFLGLRKHSPNLAIQAELGWTLPSHRHFSNATKLWCRLSNLNMGRITKAVFQWSLRLSAANKRNWCYKVQSEFTRLGLAHLNDTSQDFDVTDVLNYVNVCVFEDFEQQWHRQVQLDCR